jgi:hypothetical protein
MKRVKLRSQRREFRYKPPSQRRKRRNEERYYIPDYPPKTKLEEGLHYLAWKKGSAWSHAQKLGFTKEEFDEWIVDRKVVQLRTFLMYPIGGQKLDWLMRKTLGVGVMEEVKVRLLNEPQEDECEKVRSS